MLGGMERLVWHLVDALSQQYKVHVIGPRGSGAMLPAGVTATEIPLTPMWLFLVRTKFAAVMQALKFRPDLVIAGSGLTAPFAWLVARLFQARCVVYLHGLDIEVSSPVYQWLWKPFFRRFDLILVNSRFTRRLAEEAGVAPSRIAVLNPGVTLPDMGRAEMMAETFRNRLGLGQQPVLLYAGRITERKGLLQFVRDILPNLLIAKPNLKLVVVGTEPSMALNREQSLKEHIQHAIRTNMLEEAVIFLGDATDEQLQEAYFGADALVFPVQEKTRDHEGFGMVAIEAAAHGLPTVAFDVGGVGDAVADGLSGRLVSAGCSSEFAQAVLAVIERAEVAFPARAFAEAFAWEHFGRRLRELVIS